MNSQTEGAKVLAQSWKTAKLLYHHHPWCCIALLNLQISIFEAVAFLIVYHSPFAYLPNNFEAFAPSVTRQENQCQEHNIVNAGRDDDTGWHTLPRMADASNTIFGRTPISSQSSSASPSLPS